MSLLTHSNPALAINIFLREIKLQSYFVHAGIERFVFTHQLPSKSIKAIQNILTDIHKLDFIATDNQELSYQHLTTRIKDITPQKWFESIDHLFGTFTRFNSAYLTAGTAQVNMLLKERMKLSRRWICAFQDLLNSFDKLAADQQFKSSNSITFESGSAAYINFNLNVAKKQAQIIESCINFYAEMAERGTHVFDAFWEMASLIKQIPLLSSAQPRQEFTFKRYSYQYTARTWKASVSELWEVLTQLPESLFMFKERFQDQLEELQLYVDFSEEWKELFLHLITEFEDHFCQDPYVRIFYAEKELSTIPIHSFLQVIKPEAHKLHACADYIIHRTGHTSEFLMELQFFCARILQIPLPGQKTDDTVHDPINIISITHNVEILKTAATSICTTFKMFIETYFENDTDDIIDNLPQLVNFNNRWIEEFIAILFDMENKFDEDKPFFAKFF